MWSSCPNCDRGLGLRWRPSLAKRWQCRCGVSIEHNLISFLEAWLRPLMLWGFLIGTATVFAVQISGTYVVIDGSYVHVVLAALSGGAAGAVALGLLLFPIGCLLAVRIGMRPSATYKIKALTLGIGAMALAALALWLSLHFSHVLFKSNGHDRHGLRMPGNAITVSGSQRSN